MCNEIWKEVGKINEKFEETQKTLSLILAKLINPNAVQVDGFAPPPRNTITPATLATSSTTTPVPSTNTITPVTPSTTQVTSSTTALVDTAATPANGLTSPIHFEEVQPSSNNVASARILNDDNIQCTKMKSCLQKIFLSRLVRELFDEETRRKSNVAGKLGKSKLNPVLMEYVKSSTF